MESYDLNVLIVEKEREYVELLRRALVQNNISCPIHDVSDGQDAIDFLCAKGEYEDRARYPFPNVIFTEIRLPRVGGFEILEWLHEHPDCSVIPVVILSVSDLDEDIRKAYFMGASSYIIKPLTFDELSRTIRVTLEYWALCAKPVMKSQKC